MHGDLLTPDIMSIFASKTPGFSTKLSKFVVTINPKHEKYQRVLSIGINFISYFYHTFLANFLCSLNSQKVIGSKNKNISEIELIAGCKR